KTFSDSYFQKIYGLTQDPKTNSFMFVMEFAIHGDLHNYLLKNLDILSWKEKLDILLLIARNLKELHDKDIIHCDFHSGNILINHGDPKINVKICDFGTSKLADVSSDYNEVYGVISYIAPEVFKHGHYTKKSDIYSLGMIIWEVMSGYKPFYGREHDVTLILDILDGLRPNFIEGIPKEINDLMKKCWENDPLKRPTA
ncbi:kinase-like domain-containing protein, partial [Gigaspora rosea]